MATPAPTGGAPPTTQTTNAMETHVRVVAILDFVLGALLVLTAVGVILAFGIGTAAVADAEQYGAPSWVASMMATLGFVFGALFGIGGAVSLVAGARLIGLRRNAKGLAMGAAVVHLVLGLLMVMVMGLGLLGLAAGIYMMVILANKDTDAVLVN